MVKFVSGIFGIGVKNMDKEARKERLERFTRIFTKSRQKTTVSQEKMAAELDVSRRTIQNWEMGKSCPDFFQTMEWFRVLKINPIPYYLEYVFPKEFSDLQASDSGERIAEALKVLLESLSEEQMRALLFLFHADHGSSPTAVLQMIVAHLHCDMKSRVTVARSILENFEMCEQRGELVAEDHIMPHLDVLRDAVERGKMAANKKEKGYSASYSDVNPS